MLYCNKGEVEMYRTKDVRRHSKERPGQQLRERDHTTGTPAQHRHAHHLNHCPTGKVSADWALHSIDNKIIRGHADWFQRAFSYLLIGGLSVVVNLLVFSILYYQVSSPLHHPLQDVVAFALPLIESILANIFPTDAFTFPHRPGQS